MTLPKRPKQHEIGDKAVAVLKMRLPQGWVINEIQKDYGIDVDIEIAAGVVTGNIFRGQVKGHEVIGWNKSDKYQQSVQESTQNYWRILPIPVIVFCVDNNSEEVYWSPIEKNAQVSRVSKTSIEVQRRNKIPDTIKDLEKYILDWIGFQQGRRLLYSIPILNKRLKLMLEQWGRDCFLPIGDEDYYELEDLYLAIQRLAISVGAETSSNIPWTIWRARSADVINRDELLYWGVYDEIVKYLEILFNDAVQKADQLLSNEPYTLQNERLKNYLEKRFGDNSFSFEASKPLPAITNKQWYLFEQQLDDLHILNMRKYLKK